MLGQLRWLTCLFVLAAPSWAAAEQVRFHYVPTDASGGMTAVPVGPEGALGELRRGLGVRTFPYPYNVRPTQIVTFRHPATGRNATVPVRLPADPPRMEYVRDRIIYNYGDYTVEVRFLPDGSIDVVYNSGLLRPLKLD